MCNLIDATQVRGIWLIPHLPRDLGAGGIVFASFLCRASVALGILPQASAKGSGMPGESQTMLVPTESESNNG